MAGALVIVGYVAAAALALFAINLGVPYAVEQALSVVALPLFFMFVPLYPLFEWAGLMAGEYWRLPSALGLVVGTAIYALAVYLVMAAATRRPSPR